MRVNNELIDSQRELAKTTHQLRERSDLLDKIVSTSPSAIFVFTRFAEVGFANQRGLEMFGLPDNVAALRYTRPLDMLRDLRGFQLSEEKRPVARLLESGQVIQRELYSLKQAEPPPRVVSLNGAPLRSEAGEIEGAVVTIEDVTERHRDERERIAELEREIRELGRAAAAVGSLPAAASAADPEPMRQRLPEVFDRLVAQADDLTALSIEQHTYRVSHREKVRGGLLELSSRLAALDAGPRDVVDVFVEVYRGRRSGDSALRLEKVLEEGRVLMLETMGYLASDYRRRWASLRPGDAAKKSSPAG